jgi:LDH2 family malate/lactate/ureidoglycolate dehydrogenase
LPGDRRLASRAHTTVHGVEVDDELLAVLNDYAEHGSPAGR